MKQQRGGRATFLPLTTIKPRQLPAHILTQAAAVEGFIGIASEQVSYPDQIQTVVQNLLGTILLAKDLTSANAIAQTIRYQYRVVSLEGDVMNAGGSMTGGANKRGNQGSLFVQNQELKQLTSEFEEADKQLQAQEKSSGAATRNSSFSRKNKKFCVHEANNYVLKNKKRQISYKTS